MRRMAAWQQPEKRPARWLISGIALPAPLAVYWLPKP